MLKRVTIPHLVRHLNQIQRQVGRKLASRAGRVVLSILAILLILGLTMYFWLTPAPRRVAEASENSTEPKLSADPEGAITHESPGTVSPGTISKQFSAKNNQSVQTTEQQLEGHWSGYYQGQRRLSVNANGSGVMTAEPEGLTATLLAAKLTFEIRWKINANNLEFETIGGTPQKQVKLVLRMYGAKRSHKILKLTRNAMTLLDEDGVTKYEWHRIEPDSDHSVD